MILAVCSILVFGGCNKNKKFNKILNGTWAITMIDGKAVDANEQSKITFAQDGKDDGKVTIEDYDKGKKTDTYTGTYKISDKGETLVIDASSASFTYKSTGKISDETKTKFNYTPAITLSGSTPGFTISGLTVTQAQVLEKQ